MSHSSPAQASGLKSEPDGKTGQKLTPGKAKRKTKRLVWTDELHLRFVSAVFECALSAAQTPPSTVMLVQIDGCVRALTDSGGEECVSQVSASRTCSMALRLRRLAAD
jgi:hypothetical protein